MFFVYLSVSLFANIFSHSVGILLVLFMVSFAIQKLLSLIRSHLFIFVFIFITLGCCSKRLLWFTSKSVLPVYSSKSLIVFDLTFRSLIYFEFIFLCSVREYCNFILLLVVVHFFPAPLIEETAFSIVYSCFFCCRLIDHRCVGLYLGFPSFLLMM